MSFSSFLPCSCSLFTTCLILLREITGGVDDGIDTVDKCKSTSEDTKTGQLQRRAKSVLGIFAVWLDNAPKIPFPCCVMLYLWKGIKPEV